MTDTTAEHLAWEAERRRRAGASSLLGGLLVFAGLVASLFIRNDSPSADYVDSLQRAAQPGRIGAQPSLRGPTYEYIDAHAAGILLSTAVSAIGFVGVGIALSYLARATHARRAEFPRAGLWLPPLGAGLMVLQTILIGVGSVVAAHDFLSSARTVDASLDVNSSAILILGSLMRELIAPLAFGAAFVLVCLNAMRAGLLTRLMGVLGIAVGVFAVVRIGGFQPLLQLFWLTALGILILGWWPGAVPPAWRTGKAEPWPSNQQLREARRAEQERRRGGAPPEPAAPEPVEVPAGDPHPSSKKRKRKRRH